MHFFFLSTVLVVAFFYALDDYQHCSQISLQYQNLDYSYYEQNLLFKSNKLFSLYKYIFSKALRPAVLEFVFLSALNREYTGWLKAVV